MIAVPRIVIVLAAMALVALPGVEDPFTWGPPDTPAPFTDVLDEATYTQGS